MTRRTQNLTAEKTVIGFLIRSDLSPVLHRDPGIGGSMSVVLKREPKEEPAPPLGEWQWRGSPDTSVCSEWRRLCLEHQVPPDYVQASPEWEFIQVRLVVGGKVEDLSPFFHWTENFRRTRL